MYESPKLNRVGAAEDVILGMVPTGGDVDANWIVEAMEYADDADEVFPPQS